MPGETSGSGGRGFGSRPVWRWIVRIALAGVVLAALLAFVPRRELSAAMGGVPPAVWVGAPIAFLAVHLIGVLKWRLLVNAGGAALPLRMAARCYYSGLFGNLFLPSIVGGDAVRAGLALPHSRSRSGLLLGSLVDRVLDLGGLVALAFAATLALPAAVAPSQRGAVGVVMVTLLLAGSMLVAVLWRLPYRRVPFRLRRLAGSARRAFRRLRSRPGVLVAAFVLGVGLQLLLLALAVWLGRWAGVETSLTVWLVVWPLAKLAALVPVTQGGIGVREAALVTLFGPFGVAAVPALATGLLFEAMLVGGSLAAGGLALALGDVRRRANGSQRASA